MTVYWNEPETGIEDPERPFGNLPIPKQNTRWTKVELGTIWVGAMLGILELKSAAVIAAVSGLHLQSTAFNLPPSIFRLQSTAFILVSKSANIHSLHSIHFTIMSSQHQLTSHYLHCHFCLVFAILHLQLGFCQRSICSSSPRVQTPDKSLRLVRTTPEQPLWTTPEHPLRLE